ncbi:hypothetical protein DPMN_157510 [Dreissena polymorpha]|uniref:Uncharacterized protein n=1 Tax=Dreissena polymorpha TaxID=45954 RepID=A0A9D4INW5_DREPO|nr:hypothetical protein DPMN_157510 [Dreissena polymorpha]
MAPSWNQPASNTYLRLSLGKIIVHIRQGTLSRWLCGALFLMTIPTQPAYKKNTQEDPEIQILLDHDEELFICPNKKL